MNILVIEDCGTISRLIERTLTSYGYIVHSSGSNHNLIPLIQTAPFEIIILNTKLDKIDSFNLCKKIRKMRPRIFIIGINHNGTWQDKTKLLNIGADECLSFPFPTQELIARIQSLLRRPKTKVNPHLKCGNIRLIPHKKKAYYQSKELKLTKKEFNLLEYMMRNKERPLSRSELLDHVWDYKTITTSNTVDVHIQKLRQKLRQHKSTSAKSNLYTKNEKEISYEDSSNIKKPDDISEIQTIHGIGYKLENPKTEKSYQDLDNLPNIE